MFFVPHFGHAKVYETSIWTPCFQISAKTLGRGMNEFGVNIITILLSIFDTIA